ncbi:MAG: hypothetical protein O9343_16505 [Burkholderiaceae bacterium]|jgi:hypothetical protein|nr:hypothetical protein [Burkholderiaceae bacterium]MCZ8176784.1 hypothetical protein [Burkholderiaceae bacterium]
MHPIAAVALVLALASQAAWADPDALRRCRALADDAARLARYDAIAKPAGATAPGAAPAAAGGLPAARFGLHEEPSPVDRMESRIAGRFEGWGPRDRVRLANGQVWQVVDDSRGAYWLDSPRAVVRRGALGSYLLEVDGVRALVRVRRVE